mgnify:CR=1 FL=1
MAPKNFSVSQDEHGIYHVQGELSIHELDELKGFLERSLEGGQKIVISLAKVRFIDTAALQLLIVLKRWLKPEGELRICAVSADVERILSLSGLKAALL